MDNVETCNDHRPFLVRLFTELADELQNIANKEEEEGAVKISFQPLQVSETLTCGEFFVTTPVDDENDLIDEEVKSYRIFAAKFHRHLNRDWSMLLLEKADGGTDKGRTLVSNNPSAIYTLLVEGW